jgi:MFS family permease
MSKISSLSQVRLVQLLATSNGLGPYFAGYLIAWHVTPSEIALLLAVSQVTKSVLRVPASFLAERCPRTLSLVVGTGACTASMVLYGLASTWSEFLIASLVAGVGNNLFSGPDSALVRVLHRRLYPDSWKKPYTEYVVELNSLRALVESVTCAAAAVLAFTLGIRAVIIAQGASVDHLISLGN